MVFVVPMGNPRYHQGRTNSGIGSYRTMIFFIIFGNYILVDYMTTWD